MSEFKGTPKPWHLDIPKFKGRWAGFNTMQGECYGIYATNDDLEAIACVPKDNMLFHSTQNHLANAQLIAAAPDLLEALQTILDGWDNTPISWKCLNRHAPSSPKPSASRGCVVLNN